METGTKPRGPKGHKCPLAWAGKRVLVLASHLEVSGAKSGWKMQKRSSAAPAEAGVSRSVLEPTHRHMPPHGPEGQAQPCGRGTQKH